MTLNYSIKSTKNIDFTDSLFEDYLDQEYLKKLHKVNRPVIAVTTKEGILVGCAILCHKRSAIKINLLIVHKLFRHTGLGKSLLKVIVNFVDDTFCEATTCYTVCPEFMDTTDFQTILLKQGFLLTTIKANGDTVFTYATSVQKRSR